MNNKINNIIWTKERCHKIALKYKSRKKFEEKEKNIYNIVKNKNWLNDICSHMSERKPNGYWTYDKCKEEALKYIYFSEFKNNATGAYIAAQKNNWLEDICSHMKETESKWTKEKCQLEALKYSTRIDFQNNSGSAYQKASKNKWLEDICIHMKKLKKPSGYWTYDRCKDEALKYFSKNQFKEKSAGAFDAAIKNKWLEDICSHMFHKYKPIGYWNIKENCEKEAKKYQTFSEFQKKSKSAYLYTWKNNWLEDICSHMTDQRKLSKKEKELLLN